MYNLRRMTGEKPVVQHLIKCCASYLYTVSVVAIGWFFAHVGGYTFSILVHSILFIIMLLAAQFYRKISKKYLAIAIGYTAIIIAVPLYSMPFTDYRHFAFLGLIMTAYLSPYPMAIILAGIVNISVFLSYLGRWPDTDQLLGHTFGMAIMSVSFAVIIHLLRSLTRERDNYRQLNIQLQETNKQLVFLAEDLKRKNTELNQFAYVASHDLKAPLRGITNLVEWIEEELEDALQGEARKYMDLLQVRAQRMENLIDGLLQYSRVGSTEVKKELVNCQELLKEVLEDLSPPLSFRFSFAENLPQIFTNRVGLKQVLLNLIGNAVKHHTREDGLVEVTVREAGRFYEFSIADDGPGVAPEFQQKIFVLFQTLKPRDTLESTGIGLPLVKKIVEEQGGEIRVASEEGKGAIFSFTWPKGSEGDTADA